MKPSYIPLDDNSSDNIGRAPGFWRRLASYLAFLLPLIAAFAKAFTNSYSTLSIFVFFVAGVWVVNPALFTGPLFIVICALGVATIIVSLNMEGRSLYRWLCGEEKAKQDSLDAYIIGPIVRLFTSPFTRIKKYVGQWPDWLILIGQLVGFLIFTLSSMTKGFAMAPGIFHLLGLASLGVWGWVILGVAVLAVMGVSAAKEGKKLLKQMIHWETPKKSETPPAKAAFWKQVLAYFFASLLPLVAAAAKAFGYSYGFLMLLAFIYTGSFTATAAVSAWLPLIIVMGVGVSLVSLRMEGYSLFRAIRRAFIADEEIPGYVSKYYNEETEWPTLRADAKAILERKEKELQDLLDRTDTKIDYSFSAKRLGIRFLSFLFNYLISWTAPLLTFVAKSSIMMVGTISAIVLLSGGTLAISWWLLLIGAIAGVTVGLVSLRKEGIKTRDTVNKYYIEIMYKCLVDKPKPKANVEDLKLAFVPPPRQVSSSASDTSNFASAQSFVSTPGSVSSTGTFLTCSSELPSAFVPARTVSAPF